MSTVYVVLKLQASSRQVVSCCKFAPLPITFVYLYNKKSVYYIIFKSDQRFTIQIQNMFTQQNLYGQ